MRTRDEIEVSGAVKEKLILEVLLDIRELLIPNVKEEKALRKDEYYCSRCNKAHREYTDKGLRHLKYKGKGEGK